MGLQGLEDLVRELVGIHAVLVNVMKHIAEALIDLGPSCPIDGSLLEWINNKHKLHTCNIIVSR